MQLKRCERCAADNLDGMASSSGTIADPARALVVEWSLCGIAFAAARFIPVPLVDDAVKDSSWGYAVHRTLKAHDRTYDDDAIPALTEREDDSSGMLRTIRGVPRRILLFPIRKYVAIFGAVRGVPNDVMRVVLLGRTVHRALAQGRLANDATAPALRSEAEAIRDAYDAAVKNQDFRLLRSALGDGLSHGRGLTRAAVSYARGAFARDDEPKLKPGGEVERGAERIEAALRRPEVVEQLEEFDHRVDERLANPRR